MEVSNKQNYRVLLFYKFVSVPNPELIRQEQEFLCNRLGLLGRIIIATEGINGTVSGTVKQTECYMNFLAKHSLFAGIEFKVDEADTHAFHKMHVRVKDEIIHFGAGSLDTVHQGGKYIEPQEFQALLRDNNPDVVVLDTRSTYEYEIGKFKGAQVLDIEHFRELTEKLESLSHLKEKTIVTYCTGGIRCEKATALMIKQGFKNVYQLHGGIIRYGKETGGENFEGRCYVFDNRISVAINEVNPTIVGKCIHCEANAEKMINCANALCNEQVIVCEVCGAKYEGSCSTDCMDSEQRRVYNGKGQYYRGENSKEYIMVQWVGN